MPLVLTVVEGPQRGREYRVEEAGAFLLGRSRAAQFSLGGADKVDSRISNRHALVEFYHPRCWIHKLSQKNLLLLNQQPVDSANVRDGDRITLGKTTLLVRITAPQRSPVSPLPPMVPRIGATAPARLPEPVAPAPVAPAPEGRCVVCGRSPLAAGGSTLCPACEAAASGQSQPLQAIRLVGSIGKDSLGRRYVAVDRQSGRALSVRVIYPASLLSTAASREFLERLRQLQTVEHRHLARVESVQVQAGIYTIVSPWQRATNLTTLLRKRRSLPLGDALSIGMQLLGGLAALHAAGLAHGGLRPRSLEIGRLSPDRRGVRVLDAGLEAACQRLGVSGCVLPSEEARDWSFTAPEVLADRARIGPASDQYSAAAIVYNLLTGHRPYRAPRGESAGRDRLVQKLRDEPVLLRERRPDLPSKVLSAIHCALSRDPRRRFADVRQFRAALKEVTPR